MENYSVSFTRLGRGGPPPDQVYEGVANADALAERIYRLARQRLISTAVEVVVDLEQGTANVYAGFQHVGEGTVTKIG